MRNPVFIQFHQLVQSIQAKCLVQLRNAHPVIRAVDALEVFIRAEQQDLSLVTTVGFQSFKNLLAIVEAFGKRIQFDRAIGNNAGIMPAFALGIVHNKHVIGGNSAESQFGFVLRLLFRRSGTYNLDFAHL